MKFGNHTKKGVTLFIALFSSLTNAQSQRPTDKTSCTRLGAPSTENEPVGCSWNPNYLQNGFFEFECEPSQRWLQYQQISHFQNLVFDCNEKPPDQCRYNEREMCLLGNGQQQNDTVNCYDPPLVQLKSLLRKFVETVPPIHNVVNGQSHECFTKLNNSTCTLSPYCTWAPEYEGQVEIKDFEPFSGNAEREVQAISILYPEAEQVAEVQRVSVKSGEYNRLITTITTMASVGQQVVGGSFSLGISGVPGLTDSIGFNSSADELGTAIRTAFSGSLGSVSISVTRVGSHSRSRVSWEVTFSGNLPGAPDETPELLVATAALSYSGTTTVPPNPQVLVTRHARTRQRVSVYSNTTLSDVSGSFTLTFTQPTLETVEVLSTAETEPIPWTATSTELETALEGLSLADGKKLDFVHVERVSFMPHTKHPEIDELVLRNAWDIVFASVLQEYEFGEHELDPKWVGSGCLEEVCDQFMAIVGATEIPSRAPTQRPTSSPTDSPSLPLAELPNSTTDRFSSPTNEVQDSTTLGSFEMSIPHGRSTLDEETESVTVLVASETLTSGPRVHGSFFLEFCKFQRFLPGLLRVTSASNRVVSSCSLTQGIDVAIGDVVKIAGQQFTVTGIETGTGEIGECDPENYDGFGSTIILSQSFKSFEKPGTNETGLDGLLCSYETSRTMSHSMRAQGSEFTSTVRQRIRDLTGMEVKVSRTGPSFLGEYSWQITFATDSGVVTSREEIPLFRWKPATGGRALRGAGSSVVVEKIARGVGLPSGTFRLAFAGYDGDESMYSMIRNQHFEEAVELGPTSSVGGVFTIGDSGASSGNEGSDSTSAPAITPPPTSDGSSGGGGNEGSQGGIVAYSRPIPVGTGEGVLEDGLESMATVLQDGIRVTRVPVSLYVNETGVRWVGFQWTVTFLTDSIDLLDLDIKNIEKIDANLPLLSPFSVLALQGTGARLIITPIQDGTGKLFQTATAEVVEFAISAQDTPCMVNSTQRVDQLVDLGLSQNKIDALADLDEYMNRCARGTRSSTVGPRLPSRSECESVTVSVASSTDVGTATGDSGTGNGGGGSGEGDVTNIPLCVWRGDPLFNATSYPSESIFQKSAIIDVFFDMKDIYGGRSSLINYSGCTVPLTYLGQQIVKVYSLSKSQQDMIVQEVQEYSNPEFNNTDISANKVTSRDLVVLLNQFQTCTSNDLLELRIPATQFIEVWQYVVTFTCYTCAIAYGVGGGWLAYRMKRLTLSMRDLGWTVLIVVFGLFLGGMIGFIAGSLPAALLSQIYSSIPHNLSTESAISLGVSLGLILLYFDLGRGSNARIE